MRYEYEKKPKICPVCGSKKIANILYGLPVFSEKLNKDIETGKIVLGGCIITDDDPAWQCTVCKKKFYRKRFDSRW